MLHIAYKEVREWPGGKRPAFQRTKAPFKAHATRLWVTLDKELSKLNAKDIELFGYWQRRDFRRDGIPYSDARPSEPGIILSFALPVEASRAP